VILLALRLPLEEIMAQPTRLLCVFVAALALARPAALGYAAS
jgi:hypothetical protein